MINPRLSLRSMQQCLHKIKPRHKIMSSQRHQSDALHCRRSWELLPHLKGGCKASGDLPLIGITSWEDILLLARLGPAALECN
ncbi:hypothetical protein NC651_007494 [Populus alba x Populus x berolinensis]|nr:hypothetical protein NC651_007494 [Populus alba x Populus x berolinensis]